MVDSNVMQAALPLLAIYFVVGCVAGSFVTVCVYRLPRQIPLAAPPSMCDKCKHGLAPADMIPVVGWLLLKGRCRSCGAAISGRYPLVEFVCGVLFAICGLVLVPGIKLWLAFFFTGCLLVHVGTDIDHQLLFDKVTTLLVPSGVVYAYYAYGGLWNSFYGALAAGLLMYIVYLASRGGMGFGDVKLAFALGIWLGWQGALLCLLLAFVSGGFIGMALVAGGVKKRRDRIAFGPFLCAAAFIALLWGGKIISWYMQMF